MTRLQPFAGRGTVQDDTPTSANTTTSIGDTNVGNISPEIFVSRTTRTGETISVLKNILFENSFKLVLYFKDTFFEKPVDA